MLFKTFDEVRSNAGFLAATGDFSQIKQDILMAEDLLRRKYVGNNQMDAIQTKYDDETLLAADTTLLEHLQRVIAHLALSTGAAKLNVNYQKSGIQSHKSDRSVPAREWMLNQLKLQLKKDVAGHLDILLRLLENNRGTYTVWAADDMVNDVKRSNFVSSLDQFQKYYGLNDSFATFYALKPAITFVEDTVLENALGSDFYSEIKANMLSASTGEYEDTLISKFLQPVISFLAIKRACEILPISIEAGGIFINEFLAGQDTNHNKAVVDQNQLGRLKDQMVKDANGFLVRMVDYLNTNADDFATWKASDYFVDPEDDEVECNINEQMKGFYRL